jgi:hypothetical protein
MVEFRSRRCYGGDGIPEGGLSRRPVGRGCARRHRCSLDRAGSGQAVRRAGIGSRYVARTQERRACLIRTNKKRESMSPD